MISSNFMWAIQVFSSLLWRSRVYDGNRRRHSYQHIVVGSWQLSIKTAEEYLEKYYDDRGGCELIKYIIQEARYNPMRHISSKELKERLLNRKIEIGDPIVKVSELRDHGVLLVSPIGKKGYKFPTSEKELAEFYNRLSANVVPQLRRGYILNEVLKERSVGKYNIMNDSRFETLCELSQLVYKRR